MHYQHRFHAGNFADVFKHVLLCGLLRALNGKDAPWAYFESHAGAGFYDLHDEAAGRTAEFHDGIARLLAAASPPAAITDYLTLVRVANRDGGAGDALKFYPGSPWLAQHLARSSDRLVLCERVAAITEELRVRMGVDRRVAVHQREGYELHALLPPAEKRGLVLIDPPFERPDEFDAVAAAVARAMARFANGVYAIWYPYKKRFDTERWLRRIQRDLQREAINYVLETGAASEGQMHACGMLIINPPYAFTQQIEAALPWLAQVLAQGSGAAARSERWPAKS